MPGGFLDSDVGFPRLEQIATAEGKFAAIEDYNFKLLENLRYVLRNIGPDNLNQPEVVQWLLSLGFGKGGDPYKMVGMEAVYEVQIAETIIREETLPQTSSRVQTVASGLSVSTPVTYARLDGSTSSKTAPMQTPVSMSGLVAVYEITAPGE